MSNETTEMPSYKNVVTGVRDGWTGCRNFERDVRSEIFRLGRARDLAAHWLAQLLLHWIESLLG
jgi:hypothetical protein